MPFSWGLEQAQSSYSVRSFAAMRTVTSGASAVHAKEFRGPLHITYRPVRLTAGADLRRDLETVTNDSGAGFVIVGIGSLSNPRLRFAGAEEKSVLNGSFEILSLCGTLTLDGAHLHMVVSNEHG